MAKRSAVEQIVIEEKTVSDAVLKLISSKEKASAWHLKWAKFEEDEYLIFLFTKLAEMRWIWNECFRQFSEKHLDYTKTFKEIYHKERVIEDTKKALQTCEATKSKIKKQIESAQKKGDSVKLHSLDREYESQQVMNDHLQKKIDAETRSMFSFKIDQIQKGLKMEAQAGQQLTEQMRHVYIAQRRIADIIGSSTSDGLSGSWQMITQSIIGLSDALKMYPPPSGAVDPLPSPSESPLQGKKISTHDSPIHSPQSATANTNGRRSFPFTYRPLPHEPADTDHMTSSHVNKLKFARTSSDVTPQTMNSSTLPFKHKTSVTIFEESQEYPPPHRSRSASQPSREMFLSLQRNAANMNLNGSNGDLSPSRSRSYNQQDVVSLSSQEDVSNKSSRVPSDVENPGGPDSESGYADPIDALRKYYESHTPPNSDMSSLDAPYQHVSVVQKLREAQMSKVSNYDDDPTYSRPFDCLVGLPNPLKVRGETAPKKIISPLVLQRHSTPDFPVSLAQNRHPAKRRTRSTRKPAALRRSQSSSDEDELSSSLSPSPEPIYSSPIIHADGGDLLDGEDIIGEGNILENDDKEHSEILNGDEVGSIDSLEVQSPSPSPLEEVSRFQNGFARVMYPGVLVPSPQ